MSSFWRYDQGNERTKEEQENNIAAESAEMYKIHSLVSKCNYMKKYTYIDLKIWFRVNKRRLS